MIAVVTFREAIILLAGGVALGALGAALAYSMYQASVHQRRACRHLDEASARLGPRVVTGADHRRT